jgi:hypothetical protein
MPHIVTRRVTNIVISKRQGNRRRSADGEYSVTGLTPTEAGDFGAPLTTQYLYHQQLNQTAAID